MHLPSLEAVAGASPDPAAQLLMVTAPHASPLLFAENVEPTEHFAHTPSLEAVAADKPWPAAQLVTRTLPHASPLLFAENVLPTSHFAHTPLRVVVPGLRPWPAGHDVTVCHAQLVARTSDEYFPVVQVVHWPSPDAAYVPAVHCVRVDVPAHLYPAVHALHAVRVVVPLPPDVYEVDGHVLHELAALLLYLLSTPQFVQ